MGKIIFWVVVIFVVLFALRLVERRQGEAPRRATHAAPAIRARPAETMVRCAQLRRLPAAGRRASRARRAYSAASPAASRAVDEPAPGCDNRLMQPAPAAPPFEPLPLPMSAGRIGAPHPVDRRALSRGLRRGAARHRAAARPQGARHRRRRTLFLTCAALYFVFGLATFWWIQRDPLPLPLPALVSALLVGDVALPRARDDRRRQHRRLAADPALSAARRERLAAAHADRVLPRGDSRASCLLGLDVWRLLEGQRQRRAAVPDGTHRLRLLRDGRHRGRARPLHQGVRGSRRAARHRRREPRAGQPPHHPGHAGRRAGRRPERRRARPQRAGDAAAGRLRPDARRHAPRRIQRDAARLLAALAGGLHRGAAAVQGRVDAAPAARAARAHRLRPQRRHADLPRGPGPRAERGAADEARGDGPPHGVDRARGAQSAVGDQPGGAAARGGRRGRPRGRSGCSA